MAEEATLEMGGPHALTKCAGTISKFFPDQRSEVRECHLEAHLPGNLPHVQAECHIPIPNEKRLALTA